MKLKINSYNKFLLATLVLYVVVGIFNSAYAKMAWNNFLKSAVDIVPILIFVFAVIFITNIFVGPEFIKKHLGQESGLRGWFYVILGSIIISGPPYVKLPLFGEFKKHGMKDSLIAAFFFNNNVQLAFLPVLIYYFGLKFAVVVSIYILMFSIIGGFVIGKILKKQTI